MKNHHSHFWLRFFETILLIVAFFAAAVLISAGTGNAWRNPDIEAVIQAPEDMSPNDSVTIKFSQVADPAKFENKISLSPSADISLNWKKNNSELDIKPNSHFTPGKIYSLSILLPRGLLQNKFEERRFEFKIRSFPVVENVVPGKDETMSVDSNMDIALDSSAKDFDISFAVSPGEYKIESDNEKRQFKIIPSAKLEYDAVYQVKIAVKPATNNGAAQEKEIFSGEVRTEKKPAPAVRDTSAIIPDEQVVDLFARIMEGKYIGINLAKQHLSIFENGSRLGTYRISSGKRGMATPTGNFKIMSKRGRAWSNKYKLFMPYFMLFTGVGHGIHELPEWPGGYKEGAAHLGIPVSHGCVRLGIGPAETVYNFSSIGTPIVIHY